jgi:RNA polymerase sigma factor (sigma-70 family)
MTDTEIYQYVSGWHPYLCKHVGAQDAEDVMHEWFLAVGKANRLDRIQGPFSKYAWATLQNIISRRWTGVSFNRLKLVCIDEEQFQLGSHAPDPERALLIDERRRIAQGTFLGLKPKQREVLTRFYLNDESRESIQQAMGLTKNTFRLLKTRSKAAYEKRCKAQFVTHR